MADTDEEPATVEPEVQVEEEESTEPDLSFAEFEESLLSFERLDRTSPELWPEKIPGVTEFITTHYTPPSNPKPTYTPILTSEDNNLLHQYASLSTSGLIAKVKELHDLAYQLGVEEAKEMTRAKYLNLFQRNKSKEG